MATPATAPRASLSPDAVYWKGEAQKAIRERDELKRSLTAADGPGAHWRGEAKKTLGQLGQAGERIGELRGEVQRYRERAIQHSEALDQVRRDGEISKQRLWEIWSGLDDDAPLKAQLWEVWTAL